MYEDQPQELVHDLVQEATFGSTSARSAGDRHCGRDLVDRAPRDHLYHGPMYFRATVVVAAAGMSNTRHAAAPEPGADAGSARAGHEGPASAPGRSSKAPPPGLRFQRKDIRAVSRLPCSPGISRLPTAAASQLRCSTGFWAASARRACSRRSARSAHGLRRLQLRLAYDTRPDRRLHRHARGRTSASASRSRASRSRTSARGISGRGARTGEGEPEGPNHAFDGVDLEPDEPAREVADLRHGIALDRADSSPRSRRSRPTSWPSWRVCCWQPRSSRRPESARTRSASWPQSSASILSSHARRVRIALFGHRGKDGVCARARVRRRAGYKVRGIGPGEEADVAGLDAALDFTQPGAAGANARAAPSRACRSWSARAVLSGAELEELDTLARERSLQLLVVPNFAIGAVLMMRFAEGSGEYSLASRSSCSTTRPRRTRPSVPARATAERLPGDVPIHWSGCRAWSRTRRSCSAARASC